MELYQFGHTTSFRVQNLVSITSCSIEQALLQLSQIFHGHTRASNSETDNPGNPRMPRWEACAQVVKSSSYCLPKKEQPAPSKGFPSTLNGSRPLSHPPLPKQHICAIVSSSCGSTKLVLFPQLMCYKYFCTIKLLHSFPSWKPLPRSKQPQKAKLKDSCSRTETLRMTMKKDNSEYSSSNQHLKCISFMWGMWNYRLLTNEKILYNTGDEQKQQTRTKSPRGKRFTSSPVMSVLLQRQCCHPSKMTALPGLWWSPQPLRRFCNHSQF